MNTYEAAATTTVRFGEEMAENSTMEILQWPKCQVFGPGLAGEGL